MTHVEPVQRKICFMSGKRQCTPNLRKSVAAGEDTGGALCWENCRQLRGKDRNRQPGGSWCMLLVRRIRWPVLKVIGMSGMTII
jgi:hypothetical protein